jgi:hypothetical protein
VHRVEGISVLTITRTLFRALTSHHWSGRRALILTLGVILAAGTVVSLPVKAYAATTEVRTALHAGVDGSGPLAVYGANIVFGTSRSTNTGGSWTPDSTLSTTTWKMAVNGTLVGYKPAGASYSAVVYTISNGVQTTYSLPSVPSSMDRSWALSGSGVAYSAYNFLTSTGPYLVPIPTGATVTSQTAELTLSGAVLWRGKTSDNHSVFAVAASPVAPAPSWVTIDGSTGAVATGSELVYVLATTSTVEICSRHLSSLSSLPTCSTVMKGTYDTVYPQFSHFDPWTIINIWTASGSSGHYTPYIWNGSNTASAPSKITLPAGSTIDQPTSAGADQYGDTPYALIRDSNTTPTIQRVNADGHLTAGFPLPPTAASSVGYLAVAPDRVVGADTRDGSTALPTWTRSVSHSGFGAETLLPLRSSGLAASGARTLVSGPAGLSVYDRGAQQSTIGDARLGQLSGPYFTRQGWNTAAQGPEIEVMTVSNASAGNFLGIAGTLFGSEYVTWATDPNHPDSARVVINDLTGQSQPRSVTLPAGTATCGGGAVWNSTLVMSCGGSKVQAFNLATGALISTLPAPSNQFVNLLDVGDGYAIVTFNNIDYNLWNIAVGSLTPLTGCTYNATSDGVGHVACSSSTELIWRDFSSLSTSAPRLLGSLASATASFSQPGSTWSLGMDTTKALIAGSVVISNSLGATVRTIATPASADGSVRVSWDGLDAAGKPAPAGPYSYTLVANATDSTGAVVSITGTGAASGNVTVVAASTVGVPIGGFANLPPSRLLDTRVTGPKLGAGQTRTLQVTGVGGVPTTGVAAVVLNVTVTETTSVGYLTVSPTGTARPTVSNLNWTAGRTIPNAVTVKNSTSGQIDLYQSGPGTAQVIVDVAGYYLAGTPTTAGAYTPLTPARILDTRSTGGTLAAGETRDLQVTGQGGVPATGVSAVVLNVTVTETTTGGYLTVFPSGTPKPLASNLNWSPGLTIPNQVIVQVGSNGKVGLFQSGSGTAQVIVDVAGYFLAGTPTQPGTFVALAPVRLMDTRSSTPIAGGGDRSLTILNNGGIPSSGVSAIVINTTVAETTAPGYLTIYPGTTTLPTASDLNWSGAGTTIPNLVTVQIGYNGTIKFHNGSTGTTHVIADTAGYYRS